MSSIFKALLRRKVLHVDSRARTAFHSFISFLLYVHQLFRQIGFLHVEASDTNLPYTFSVNVWFGNYLTNSIECNGSPKQVLTDNFETKDFFSKDMANISK